MSVITILLVLLLFAAWKAPRWVREIGHLTLALALIMTLIPLRQVAAVIIEAEDISPLLLWRGVYNLTIVPIYALIVYGISLIIRIVQKPRL